MSGERITADNHRSRSLLRQVREKLSGNRRRAERRAESSSSAFINLQHISTDGTDTRNNHVKLPLESTTSGSFTHHLSLLVNVKSRFRKTRKYGTSALSPQMDDRKALSLPPVTFDSESTATTPCDANQIIETVELDPEIPELPVTTNIEDPTIVQSNNSIDMITPDENISELNNETNKLVNSNRRNLTKIKEMTQRVRTTVNKSPSLASLLTNASVKGSLTETVYWIELHIERGKDLSIKDFNGTSDPYVKVYYGNEEKYETKIVFKNLNPVWNEKSAFFIHDLTIPLNFHIFDHDRIGRDESMGSTKIDLWKLPLEKLYSATLDLENEKRTDGKTGMLKISITITTKTPEFRDEMMRSVVKQSNRKSSLTGRTGATNNTLQSLRRTVDIFVIEGTNLAMANSSNKLFNPYARLKFGTNKKYRTQTIKSTLNPKWHQSFIYETVFCEIPPLEITVFDDTSGSGDFIGRGCCNLNHLDEEHTHKISVDLDDNAGVIDIFVTITGITPSPGPITDLDNSTFDFDTIPSKLTDYDYQRYSLFSTLKSMAPIHDVGKLEIKIYQARDLSAKDINGKSDPFCVVELDSTRLRTHTIYKTLDPVWNKSFIIPVQDIHSALELTIYDEDANKTTEFIGRVVIPLLAIKNGEKRWVALKDRKSILPVKGIIEIEATIVYANLRAILRTFNPRQIRYYQQDGKFRVAVFKQHINRVRSMLKYVLNAVKFINYCFEWENPLLSFCAFITSLVIIWNFQLYMLPVALLLIFAWNAIVEYRRGLLGKAFATLGDETVSAVIQPTVIDEDVLDNDSNTKEQKKSLLGVIYGIQDTVFEIQGYVDQVASTLERIKNIFNFTVPWLSILAIVVLSVVSIILYYIPVRYIVLAFITNKFTKNFRRPKGYIDNNELADFLSRIPSDTELLQYRELKILTRVPTPKKHKTNSK